jgi:hypothetical protein
MPTLWRTQEMGQIQANAVNSPDVKELLIISNYSKDFKGSVATTTKLHDKLKILTPPQNLYITASWNWGVREAQGDIVCLQNDDVILPKEAYKYVLNNWPKDAGIIGLGWNSLHMMGGDYLFQPTSSRGHGFGAAMFIRKENYKPIPEDLKLWFNDDWLFKYTSGQHYYLAGPFQGRMSVTTSSPEFDEIKRQDAINWKKYE